HRAMSPARREERENAMNPTARPETAAPASSRSAEAGFSMVEMIIVFALLAALGAMFGETMAVSLGADRHVPAFNAAATKGQRSANDIQEDLTAARRVYSDDSEGRGYAAATEVIASPSKLKLPAPIKSARLPVTDPLGTFAPDTKTHKTTGDSLLFVREQGTALIATTLGPTPRTLRFDLFRFVSYYLTM